MKREFPKAYQPKDAESKWYEIWSNNQIYKADEHSPKKKYSILMPPPNVTGILHFGHVLNNTLQDLYIRYKRMDGYEVCWFPGIDHAGIATQSRVEKELAKDKISRYDLGREKFLDKVWEWKEKYGGIILKQLRYLGISCDWSRTLFTMDPLASQAVSEVFVKLFDEGLIYRGKRIINWSPLAQTALSDEEVEFREVKEYLYTMRYKFPGSNEYLSVATVRPETIFGDIAVAVNPNDERYKHLIGTKVIVPLVGREVEIIADEYADPTFGTGCVKITPAHDPNDFEIGLRHNLEMINTLNPDATLNELTGEYNGMDRFVARKLILEKLKELDLIEKIEDYTHNVGFSQRGGEIVEPYLSDQWFVKMKPLAEMALAPVKEGKIKFHPEHWVKTYEHWMDNIRDWCISRQLWWGHRIPVYYTPDGRFTAAENAEAARVKLGVGSDVEIRQENDVLDTWFSSWLWPLTTMKWLENGSAEPNDIIKAFQPTDMLVTAPDIIFFWVARMIMANIKFNGEIPFKNVYFTSLIRDGKGRKLSKSLGNSPDPLNIVDKYGADAVRFTMIYLSPLGQDVKMDVDVDAQDIPSMEIGRNFANKVWNAGRFMLMKLDEACGENTDSSNEQLRAEELSFADKWILSRFHSVLESTRKSLDDFKVNDFSKQLYDFIWRDFCDWYVEILKVQFNSSEDNAYRTRLMRFAIGLYEDIINILHPVMPFITEEIWHLLGDRNDDETISLQAVPEFKAENVNSDIEKSFELLQMIVEEFRRLRSGMNIPPHQKTPIALSVEDAKLFETLSAQKDILKTFAKASELTISNEKTKLENTLSSVVREVELHVILDGAIDKDKERERLQKEINRLEGNIAGCEKKLTNEKFVNNAAPHIVAAEKEKLASMKESLIKTKENFEKMK
jgi:valyl-tRNA synthetase